MGRPRAGDVRTQGQSQHDAEARPVGGTEGGTEGRVAGAPYAVEVNPRTRRMVTLGVLAASVLLVVVAAWVGRG
jgi:hypothetical protein